MRAAPVRHPYLEAHGHLEVLGDVRGGPVLGSAIRRANYRALFQRAPPDEGIVADQWRAVAA